MQNPGLNLARVWRPKRFDELVGQDLVVRLLQNSLYRSYFFPVYLFAGQRGCGKTTSARIFATAINCRAYEQFVKDPQKTPLPCLTCNGCQMMAQGKHPDVIEIDAASHTGVDHVRQVIDAASFVPVYGQKRIYIIDEAHMLSKAAFNALLKMLEEPPLSVLFMLATTDAHKIPDTIKSRCFHLFFSPLEPPVIAEYVSRICTAESIPFDDAGLHLIARQAEGSARDAVNMVERVRLAHDGVTIDSVRQVLGCLDDASCMRLFETLFTGDTQQVLGLFVELDIEKFMPRVLLARLIEYLHGVMWVLHGVDASASRTTGRFTQALRPRGTRTLVLEMLSVCYAYEAVLARTSSGHQVFEMVCLTLCQLAGGSVSHSLDGGSRAVASVATSKHGVTSSFSSRKAMDGTEGPVLPISSPAEINACSKDGKQKGVDSDVMARKSKSTGVGKVGVNIPTGKALQLGNTLTESAYTDQLPEEAGLTKDRSKGTIGSSNEMTTDGAPGELNKREHRVLDDVQGSSKTVQQIDQNTKREEHDARESGVVANVTGDKPKSTGALSAESTVWQQLIEQVEKLNDPLVYSIFKQAARHEFNKDEKKLHLHFPRQLSFFADWLENTQSSWQPLVERCFGADITVELHFDEGEMKQPEVSKAGGWASQSVGAHGGYAVAPNAPVGDRASSHPGGAQKRAPMSTQEVQGSVHGRGHGSQGHVGYKQYQTGEARRSLAKTGGARLNLRDKEAWPKTHELLSVFPGVISINYQQDES